MTTTQHKIYSDHTDDYVTVMWWPRYIPGEVHKRWHILSDWYLDLYLLTQLLGVLCLFLIKSFGSQIIWSFLSRILKLILLDHKELWKRTKLKENTSMYYDAVTTSNLYNVYFHADFNPILYSLTHNFNWTFQIDICTFQ